MADPSEIITWHLSQAEIAEMETDLAQIEPLMVDKRVERTLGKAERLLKLFRQDGTFQSVLAHAKELEARIEAAQDAFTQTGDADYALSKLTAPEDAPAKTAEEEFAEALEAYAEAAKAFYVYPIAESRKAMKKARKRVVEMYRGRT